MRRRGLVALVLALAGTLLAASSSAPEQSVSVIEPVPSSTAADGGH